MFYRQKQINFKNYLAFLAKIAFFCITIICKGTDTDALLIIKKAVVDMRHYPDKNDFLLFFVF